MVVGRQIWESTVSGWMIAVSDFVGVGYIGANNEEIVF